MADAESLSLTFMRLRPVQAAQVLESVDPADAAALLRRVPARVAAPVFGAMLPSAAARALGDLADEAALSLLGELGTLQVVAVLRHVQEPRRTQLSEGLPTAVALASRLLMGYVEDSVGAWTDPDVVALPGATRIADALERMRHVEATLQRVFVAGDDGRPEGWVPLSLLLRAPAAASLASVMSRPDAVLPAQSPLAGVAMHPAWERVSVLPVVEAGGRLVGVLTRDALQRGMRLTRRPSQQPAGDTLPAMLALGYWEALSGGAEAITTLLPAVGPVSGAAGER